MKKYCDFFGCDSDPIEVPDYPTIAPELIPIDILKKHDWELHRHRVFCKLHRPSVWGDSIRFKEFRGMALFKFIEGIFHNDDMRPRPIGFKFVEDKTVMLQDYFIFWDEKDEEFILYGKMPEDAPISTHDMIAVQFFYKTDNRDVRSFLADIDDNHGPSAAMIDQFLDAVVPEEMKQIHHKITSMAMEPKKRRPI